MTRIRTIAFASAVIGLLAFAYSPVATAQQLVFESFPASALVRGENVWLRLDPATDTEVIDLLQRGDPITITGEPVVDGGDEFYPVEADLTGESGWIRALFIDPRSVSGTSTVVMPLEEVDVPPEEAEVVDDAANQRQQDREARRQERQANAEQEPEPEPEPDNAAQDQEARRAARQAEREGAAAEQPADESADDRAARRAARQAGQEGSADAEAAAAEELSFSGTESTVITEFSPPSDVLTVMANHEGDGRFRVIATTPDGFEQTVFDERGPFSGETTLELESQAAVTLDVQANGPWEVAITPAS